MKHKSIKYFFTFLFLLFITISGYSQKEFFRSKQIFTNEQMSNFYSSVTIHEGLVIFNANDYHLYVYNKKDGSLKWSVETNYKSTIPVFVQDSIIYAAISKKEIHQAAQFDLANGDLIKALPFGPLATKPLIKNGMLYGTAIYNFGCILAYDLEKDTVVWSRFIAHGFSRQPYYFENKFMANAEANNWVALSYDGVLLDTTCAVKASIFVEDIPCVKTFTALTHDGLEIKGKLADDIFGTDFFDVPEIITTGNFTVILSGDKISILSKKLKLKQQVEVSSLAEELADNYSTKLLKADDENLWLIYSNHLLQYNHTIKKLVRLTDLTPWQPNSVLLDGENIWLISGKDGLLYGLGL
ncbi:MAG: PQQ-binding-like beta-propeller repeat protein [Chitinophagaceae bacterium]|nr:PQQ-binding-like beta-propeller repeat protein [Chitinophagaceae bacterium]